MFHESFKIDCDAGSCTFSFEGYSELSDEDLKYLEWDFDEVLRGQIVLRSNLTVADVVLNKASENNPEWDTLWDLTHGNPEDTFVILYYPEGRIGLQFSSGDNSIPLEYAAPTTSS